MRGVVAVMAAATPGSGDARVHYIWRQPGRKVVSVDIGLEAVNHTGADATSLGG